MQVGDLVKYNYSDDCDDILIGIVVEYDTDLGCYSVQWSDGSFDHDLVYGELEIIEK
tara:strand:- start:1037 stop:1207 length:171 start_codon:yes stop_codon:yes gene_type:complete